MKTILNDIVDVLQNLSVSLDSLEEALIRRDQLKIGEIRRLESESRINCCSTLK